MPAMMIIVNIVFKTITVENVKMGIIFSCSLEEIAGKCTLPCQIVNSQHYLPPFVLSVMMDMSSTKELNVLNMILQSPVRFKDVVFVLKVMIVLTAEQDMSSKIHLIQLVSRFVQLTIALNVKTLQNVITVPLGMS